MGGADMLGDSVLQVPATEIGKQMDDRVAFGDAVHQDARPIDEEYGNASMNRSMRVQSGSPSEVIGSRMTACVMRTMFHIRP